MTFSQKLETIVGKNNSLLSIGLDSDLAKLPQQIKSGENPQFAFNKAIIDATHDLVCAYKPNIAFYEAEGVEGIKQLKLTIDYLKNKYPEIPVILDAKRADIGSSNKGYVRFAFDYLVADAITLHPYLGREALIPFLERKDKGIFILCRTSNPGAGEFQDLLVTRLPKGTSAATKPYHHLGSGRLKRSVSHDSPEVKGADYSLDSGGVSKPLYQIVAEHVVKDWNYHGNCGLVVGATYPTELQIVRRIAKNLPLLIPGIGKQGGDIEKTVKAGSDEEGQNAIINISRDIIFASTKVDFFKKAREKAIKLRRLINSFRPSF